LLRLANGRGGRDNITAIVVRALTEGLPDEDLDRTIEMAGHFDAFCRVRLLQGLNHIDLLRLRYAFDEKPFRRGDVIVEEGEIRGVVIIVDGITEVLRGGQSLGNIEPGGFFGEAGLITERESPATIGALTEGLALEMSEQEFDELNRSEPVLANALLRNLSMVLIQRLDRASGR
jgi:CRP-like cAMP-binding protein